MVGDFRVDLFNGIAVELLKLFFIVLSAWLSGAWFDLNLVGGAFQKVAYALPFVHAVDMERAVLSGDYSGVFPHLWWVLGYAAILLVLAVLLFLRQMKK